MKHAPLLRKAVLTERLVLSVDKALRDEIYNLKVEHGIDMPEFIRQVLRKEIANLRRSI